ncbi:MAG: 3-phosphoshikimate 1-carboxyvinyltransferase [Owenweeksia sp.]|mgnify:FL=1|nr:3-phosphoshikimate 1-carboxyvinyltransferase [Owenweeksia sp.]MBG00064.1 3-phosphoshikimate 1-carboxyvinyltransferase [Owenweeksia sp.]MBG00460.1 3-phosphoshikimate 1-carboxyvinyltransferase [Owenweeksia sp.]HBF19525.1 3-phosphoshikimate 1-carboxyvinyltransferase [Cryomorphaceae bacterium]
MVDVLHISHPNGRVIGKVDIPGSKSESNRLLILKHLYFPDLEIVGLSNSKDTQYLQGAFQEEGPNVNVGDAGTAMRFLTAYYALQEGEEITLSGTARMHERPIGVLVDALASLGAEIHYLGESGYPPLRIKGEKLMGGEVQLNSGVSSQFISALMMIGPALHKGLVLHMTGFSVSAPYIYLTANLMRRLGFQVSIDGERIRINAYVPQRPLRFQVEPDWSSASYWFLIGLLAQKTEIYLPGFRDYSLQGDAFVSGLFQPLGLVSHYIGSGFRLKKGERDTRDFFEISLIHNPDLAQTLAVAFAALNIGVRIKGLQTLRIKETDRLLALQTELQKTGAEIEIGDDYLQIHKGIQHLQGVVFKTWGDHRMAMSFAPLALMHPIGIEDPGVVNKSYTSFWKDLERVGFKLRYN